MNPVATASCGAIGFAAKGTQIAKALFAKEDTMAAAQAITADKFEEEVLKSDIPVMVDLWAEWCGPCKALGPTIDQIAEEYAGKIKVFKLDVQSEAAIASKYGVSSIPTLLFFKAGEVADRLIGMRPKQEITGHIDPLL